MGGLSGECLGHPPGFSRASWRPARGFSVPRGASWGLPRGFLGAPRRPGESPILKTARSRFVLSLQTFKTNVRCA
eukprot:9475906-Pyramimonas_sp.AAC.1